MLSWCSKEPKRIDRPFITLKKILEEVTGLKGNHLLTLMLDRTKWKEDFNR